MIRLPTVLTIGDERRQEFVSIMAWLQRRASVICGRTPQQVAAAPLAESEPPALVVWLQSFAGEFSAADADAVARKLPDVQMVCVYAAFAEGETRTGRPLPGIPRFPFYCWAARLERLWRFVCPPSSQAGNGAVPNLSQIASRRHQIRVGVYSGAREMQALLCEALGCLGYDARPLNVPRERASEPPTTYRPVVDTRDRCSGFTAAVWEQSRDPRAAMLSAADLVSAIDPCPVIAIASFPRWQDARQLAESGVRHLMGKPFNLAELACYLDGLAVGQAGTEPSSS